MYRSENSSIVPNLITSEEEPKCKRRPRPFRDVGNIASPNQHPSKEIIHEPYENKLNSNTLMGK